jgi:hypothetical protein
LLLFRLLKLTQLFKIKVHCNIFQIALRVIASRLVATFLKLPTGLQVATAHSYEAAALLLHQAAGNKTDAMNAPHLRILPQGYLIGTG